MATNNFAEFDTAKADIQTDAEYAADSQRVNGVSTGLARTAFHNKLFRQLSVMVAAIGQVIADLGTSVSDTSVATLVTAFKNTILMAVNHTLSTATATLYGLSSPNDNVDTALATIINSLAKKSYIWGATPSDTVIASLTDGGTSNSYHTIVRQFYVKHGGKYRVTGTMSKGGAIVLTTASDTDTDKSSPTLNYVSAVFSSASAGNFTIDMTRAVPPSTIIRISVDQDGTGTITLSNLKVCGTLSTVNNADIMEVIQV